MGPGSAVSFPFSSVRSALFSEKTMATGGSSSRRWALERVSFDRGCRNGPRGYNERSQNKSQIYGLETLARHTWPVNLFRGATTFSFISRVNFPPFFFFSPSILNNENLRFTQLVPRVVSSCYNVRCNDGIITVNVNFSPRSQLMAKNVNVATSVCLSVASCDKADESTSVWDDCGS